MDHLTRKELKTDHFVEEVGHTVDYVRGHRRMVGIWAGAALAALALFFGGRWFLETRSDQRQTELRQALRYQAATIGQINAEFAPSFPTQADKDQAVTKAFTDIATKHSGSKEGAIASYYLGVIASDKGNYGEAEKNFRQAISTGGRDLGGLARLALASILDAQKKHPEAEKLLREIVDRPSVLVSKAQATIELARMIGKRNPAEARKLLEPLRNEKSSAVSRAAIGALSELPQGSK